MRRVLEWCARVIPRFYSPPPSPNYIILFTPAEEPFRMHDEQIDATTHVIDLDDVTDHYTARELSGSIVELINSGKKHFVVDIRRATFLDEARSPLEALTSLEPRLRSAGASIALVADEHARTMFEITGLDQRFQVYGSRNEAPAAIRRRAAP